MGECGYLRLWAALFVFALLGLAGAGGASAWTVAPLEPAAAPAATAAPAKVTLLSSNRRAISRLGYVRVRVSAERASVLRLAAKARRASGGRTYRVTRLRRLRIEGGEVRRVRLRLNPAGRRIFRGCRALSVTPAGRLGRRSGASRRVRSGSRRVGPDLARCAGRGPSQPGGGQGPGTGGSGPGSGGGGSDAGGGGSGPPPEDTSASPGGAPPLGALNTADADRCDFLDPSVCLYPFPNDHFTKDDATTDTKRRLNLDLMSMP